MMDEMGGMGGELPMAVGLGGLPSIEDMHKSVASELLEAPEEVDAEVSAFVKEWVQRVKDSEKFFEAQFKRMRSDMEFVRGIQWDGQAEGDSRYVANIIQRHVNQRVSSLYAKNPTVVAKRRKTVDFQLWDETPQTLMESMQTMQMAQQAIATGMVSAPPPMIMAQVQRAQGIMQEVQEVKQRRQMMDKMGRTMEVLFNHYLKELEPNFKIQAKQLIRRVETTGVGFIKLGFQRAMQRRPDVSAKIADLSERMAYMKRLAGDSMTEFREGSEGSASNKTEAEIQELEIAVKQLLNEPEMIVKEGLVFDFPRSTSIIIDKNCINLKGFIGADWIAQKFLFTSDEIKEIYGKDLNGKVTAYYEQGKDGMLTQTVSTNVDGTRKDQQAARVMCFEIYHKPSGVCFTVADGYEGYISEPEAPNVKIERFWPIFTLTFNDLEDEKNIYPDSDVRLLRSMQIEHNRAREGLREHRIANRPAYGASRGVLEDDDKSKLASHAINELIEFNVPVGTDIATVIQPMKKVPIDPSIYDTSPFFDDIQKVVGASEANFGGVSGVAATEISVAEGARVSTLQSNIDDLDDLLSELARSAGQLMLKELSVETVTKIAGNGAVWPQLSGQDLADELYLEIEAGSSGRPNRAQEIANLERIAPVLLQVPGINPQWLAKIVVRAVDDSVDLTEAVLESMPSMTAINSMQGNPQPGTGDPATDPGQQGGAGADKTKNPQDRGGGGQPSYRQPSDNGA